MIRFSVTNVIFSSNLPMFRYFLDSYDFLGNDVLFNSMVVIFLTLIYVDVI